MLYAGLQVRCCFASDTWRGKHQPTILVGTTSWICALEMHPLLRRDRWKQPELETVTSFCQVNAVYSIPAKPGVILSK